MYNSFTDPLFWADFGIKTQSRISPIAIMPQGEIWRFSARQHDTLFSCHFNIEVFLSSEESELLLDYLGEKGFATAEKKASYLMRTRKILRKKPRWRIAKQFPDLLIVNGDVVSSKTMKKYGELKFISPKIINWEDVCRTGNNKRYSFEAKEEDMVQFVKKRTSGKFPKLEYQKILNQIKRRTKGLNKSLKEWLDKLNFDEGETQTERV